MSEANTPQQLLETEVKEAMRARNKLRLETLRMLLSAVKNQKIEAGHDLDQSEFVAVVRRLLKQRVESAELYRKGGREELAAKEEAEIVELEGFLPPAVDDGALRAAILEVIAAQGLSGPKGIGPIMKAMKEQFGDAADGKAISSVARELLAG